jgi:hypothetical protein
MSDFAGFASMTACFFAVFLAFVLGRDYGRLGFIGGAALGALAGVTLVWLISRLLRMVSPLPRLPVCKRGLCQKEDYVFEVRQNRSVYVCKCGDLYWLDDQHCRFQELSPDGALRPYMIRRGLLGLGRWQREEVCRS